MKKKIRVIVYIILFLAILSFPCDGIAKTAVPGRTMSRVNDYAGMIDKDMKEYLEKRLSSIPQITPDIVEVIIATFGDIEGWKLEEYAAQYGANWRKTKVGRDNGVILMVFPGPGRVFIGVGQNLKDVISRDRTRDIIENTITPLFNQGKYGEAIKQAAEDIIETLEKADIPKDKNSRLLPGIILVCALAIIWALIRNVRISKM